MCCVIPGNIHNPPKEGHWIPREGQGGGVLTAESLK